MFQQQSFTLAHTIYIYLKERLTIPKGKQFNLFSLVKCYLGFAEAHAVCVSTLGNSLSKSQSQTE